VNLANASSGGTRLVKRPWLFLWAPLLTMLIGFPLAEAPFSGDPRGFWAPYTLLALPFYLGTVAAPGYLAALFTDPAWLHSTTGRRLWVRLSLGMSLLCSAASVAGGLLMVLFLVPALWAFGGTVVVWRRFELAGREARGG
jgi:hypothetical protein